MKKLYTILIIAALAGSCAPVKRFNRLIKKHPHLIQTDTIIKKDTVRILVPKIKHDTAFLGVHLYDTVTIIKDRLKVEIIKTGDTIKVAGECDTLTVEKIIETKIPVKYYPKYLGLNSNVWWFILFVLLVLFFVIRNSRRQLTIINHDSKETQ